MVITIDADLSSIIAGFIVIIYAFYIFGLGAFKGFRVEVNELLSEIFDASLTIEEKDNLGPAVVIPPMVGLMVLGIMFLVLNFKAILVTMILLLAACFFTAARRANELRRKELEELGRTEL